MLIVEAGAFPAASGSNRPVGSKAMRGAHPDLIIRMTKIIIKIPLKILKDRPGRSL